MNQKEINAAIAEFAVGYPPFISARQAAEISHRCVQTIYDWSSRGALDECKARRQGRLLLSRDAFVRFVVGVDSEQGDL